MSRRLPQIKEVLWGIVAGCGAGLFPVLAYEGLMRSPLEGVLRAHVWESHEIYVNIPLYFILCAVSAAAVILAKRRCSFSPVFYAVSAVFFLIVSGLYTIMALYVLISCIF